MKNGTEQSSSGLLLDLQRATHATLQVLGAKLSHLDLTGSELNVMAILADGRARTVSEIGTAAGSRPTTLTGVLDRLERRGHITRGTRTGDRRAVLIALTTSGRRTARVIKRVFSDLESRVARAHPSEAIAGFRSVVRSLTEDATG